MGFWTSQVTGKFKDFPEPGKFSDLPSQDKFNDIPSRLSRNPVTTTTTPTFALFLDYSGTIVSTTTPILCKKQILHSARKVPEKICKKYAPCATPACKKMHNQKDDRPEHACNRITAFYQ